MIWAVTNKTTVYGEIESKYRHKTVVLLLTAHILSLQDVVFRSMFFLVLHEGLLTKVTEQIYTRSVMIWYSAILLFSLSHLKSKTFFIFFFEMPDLEKFIKFGRTAKSYYWMWVHWLFFKPISLFQLAIWSRTKTRRTTCDPKNTGLLPLDRTPLPLPLLGLDLNRVDIPPILKHTNNFKWKSDELAKNIFLKNIVYSYWVLV